MKSYDERIAALEAAIKRLRQQEAADLQASKESVPVVMEWVLYPTKDAFRDLWDDSCIFYQLNGICTNKAEAEAAGHTRIQEGGMKYLFNTLSGKFVGTFSGGIVWISKRGFRTDEETLANLNKFVAEHPEGGNITEIILDHNERNKK